MKLKILLPSLAVTLVLIGGSIVVQAQGIQTKPSAQEGQVKPPTQAPQSVWKPFTSPVGRFTVLMPGNPKRQTQTQNSPVGPIVVNSFVVERTQEGVAYMVAYSDFPDNLVERVKVKELLDGARDGALRATQSQLVSQRDITLNGHPGRELEFVKSEQITKNRMYVVNDRLYQVMVLTTKEQEKFLTRSIAGFLNSFRLPSTKS